MKTALGLGIIALYIYMFIAWIVNIVQLIGTDFGHITGLAIARIIGVFVFFLPSVTVWF